MEYDLTVKINKPMSIEKIHAIERGFETILRPLGLTRISSIKATEYTIELRYSQTHLNYITLIQ